MKIETHFTPCFTEEQQLEHSFYTRKISALTRSYNHLTSLENPTPAQELRKRECKKDIMVFKGKRTKLENMCRLF